MHKKTMERQVLVLLAAVFIASGTGKTEGGDERKLSADDILKRCDDFHFFASDSMYRINVTLTDSAGKKSYMKMELYQKGTKRRLLRFLEPRDIAGFSVLSKDPETLYVYEPSLGKVRRVASHAKKQTMLGLDFTLSEAESFRLGSDYTPRLIGEDEEHYMLFLAQKEGRDKAWPIQKVEVSKKTWHAARIEYCDEKEKVHKTETRYGLKKMGGRMIASVMKMFDHTRKHSTIYDVKEARFDQDLPDEMFTKRYLVRGR